MFGIWREKIGRPSMEENGRTMATKQGASEGDEWWVWGIGPRGATGYRVGVQLLAIKEPTSTAGPLDPDPNCQKNWHFGKMT